GALVARRGRARGAVTPNASARSAARDHVRLRRRARRDRGFATRLTGPGRRARTRVRAHRAARDTPRPSTTNKCSPRRRAPPGAATTGHLSRPRTRAAAVVAAEAE